MANEHSVFGLQRSANNISVTNSTECTMTSVKSYDGEADKSLFGRISSATRQCWNSKQNMCKASREN